MEGKRRWRRRCGSIPGGLLLVSHDRQLISQSCNRFWLIDENGLSEWHDVDEVYARLRGNERLQSPATQTPPQAVARRRSARGFAGTSGDAGTAIGGDLQRKAKHQAAATGAVASGD